MLFTNSVTIMKEQKNVSAFAILNEKGAKQGGSDQLLSLLRLSNTENLPNETRNDPTTITLTVSSSI